jgi:hypothetical protein
MILFHLNDHFEEPISTFQSHLEVLCVRTATLNFGETQVNS